MRSAARRLLIVQRGFLREDADETGVAPGNVDARPTGVRGGIRKSNRTDNESAKRATGKGVIQGDTGVAVVDEQPQILVNAQAHGVGQEQELLLLVLEAVATLRTEATVITADAGYYSEDTTSSS